MEQELSKNLERLGNTINEIITNLPKDNILKIGYIHHSTNKFDYDNQSFGWEMHRIKKIDEHFIDFLVLEKFNGSNEFKEAKKSVEQFIKKYMELSNIVKNAVKNNLDSTSILSDSFLDGFRKKVIEIILELSDNDLKLNDLNKFQENIKELINISVKELQGKPLKCQLTIKLNGIILKSNKININDDLEILKPRKEDCDMEFIDNPFSKSQMVAPSAILVFRGYEVLNGHLPIENIIRYFLAVFRLFKKGNINFIGYSFKSDAILNENFRRDFLFSDNNFLNNISQLYYLQSSSYVLENELIEPLKNFINSDIDLNKLFSDEFMHLKISYKHFSNALVSDFNSEKQIVDTIMSFEALFMKKGDKEGGSYKVKMTIARLFDSLINSEAKDIRKILMNNYGPEIVSERMYDGFRVRNKYAHGENISKTMHNEFLDKYGGIDKLLNYLIDYLRISIILMIINDKNDFLDLISISLIKNESNKELTESLNDIKQYNLLNYFEV